jgi:hypothetical protein
MFLSVIRHIFIPGVIISATMLGTWALEAKAQNTKFKPNVILILDSSQSMWGQINGVNKVVSGRKVIGGIVRKYDGQLDLGLVAYGHRRGSGCDDIQLMLKPQPLKASSFIKTVNSIKPKGSTPISASLIKAAKAVHYKERPASLILIADGLDNCNANPCDTAADLKQQGKDLVIHTIAFDAKQKKKLTALSCIADNTGGSFSSATNETELAKSVAAAFRLAMTPPMPKIASAPKQMAPQASDPLITESVTQTPSPVPAAPAMTPQNAVTAQAPPTSDKMSPQQALAKSGNAVPVTLSARTVEGGTIIKSGLVWWIYKNNKTKDGKYQLVDTFREATPTAALPPGAYRIAAVYGKVNLIKDIDVTGGRALQENFILNAGGLRLGSVTLDGTTIPPNSVRYDLFADETESDQFGKRKVILRDAKPGVVLRLNAGAYHVVSTYGDANAVVRADVTVEPGRLTDATINHSAAKVTLKLVTQPGGEALADTQWNILTTGGDIVKESAGALPSHILAAGNYIVLARHGGKNYTREFMIEPGDTKQIEVVIQ